MTLHDRRCVRRTCAARVRLYAYILVSVCCDTNTSNTSWSLQRVCRTRLCSHDTVTTPESSLRVVEVHGATLHAACGHRLGASLSPRHPQQWGLAQWAAHLALGDARLAPHLLGDDALERFQRGLARHQHVAGVLRSVAPAVCMWAQRWVQSGPMQGWCSPVCSDEVVLSVAGHFHADLDCLLAIVPAARDERGCKENHVRTYRWQKPRMKRCLYRLSQAISMRRTVNISLWIL